MKKDQTKKCKTCVHFKNCQRDLNYWDGTGFCTNNKFSFNTKDGRLVGVYDTQNERDISKITGNPAHNIETISNTPIQINASRYRLQVSDEFGCIFHEAKQLNNVR
jgi:hypothetical protein